MCEYPSPNDWICRIKCGRWEGIEAYFSGHGYSPHRHDTYAIGRTLAGVQSFNYRGAMRHSVPGGTIVLHPDEKHDGHAGTREGFKYRMIYVKPSLIQEVLGGKPLPFIANGISNNPRLLRVTNVLLQSLDNSLESLEEDDAIYDLAIALSKINGATRKTQPLDYSAAKRAQELIHDGIAQPITLDELARYAGRNRWSLSQDFRLLFGTSPHRYMTMRRLEITKISLLGGDSLAEAAMAAGFFDQCHMTRHFTKAFGLSPAKWRKIHLISKMIQLTEVGGSRHEPPRCDDATIPSGGRDGAEHGAVPAGAVAPGVL
jgi:AraC-like DNA-binding protein